MLIKETLEKLAQEKKFLSWEEYRKVCQEIGIQFGNRAWYVRCVSAVRECKRECECIREREW